MRTHFSPSLIIHFEIQLWTKETTNHWHEGCVFLLQGLQNDFDDFLVIYGLLDWVTFQIRSGNMARCEYSTSGSTCSQTRRRCLRGQNAGAKSDLCRCGVQKLSQVYICLPGFNNHCPAVLRSLIKQLKLGWYVSVCISGIKNDGNLPENMLHPQPTGVLWVSQCPFQPGFWCFQTTFWTAD